MADYTYNATKDKEGNSLNPFYPRQLLRIITGYRLPGSWNKLTVGGNLSYQSSIYYDELYGLSRAGQSGLTLLGLMARYEVNKHWSALLNIENLTDEDYYAGLGGYNGYNYGTPCSGWLRVRYQF